MKFAESAFQSEPDVLDHFKKFIFSNPVINSLMYLPVNCAIITQVYKDIRRMGQELMPKTMTQLYTTLIRVLIRRHLIKIRRWDENSKVPRDLKHLPKDIYADLQRLSALAYYGLIEEDFQLVFTDDDVISDHLGLMNEVKEMYVCEGAKTSYSFLHLSIQEFLAAWYASKINFASYFSYLYSVREHPHIEMFVRFLFGVIGQIASEMNLLLEDKKALGMKTELLFHCLYEAQNPEFVSKFIESSQHNSIGINHPLDLYVFGYILVHAPIQWKATISTSCDMLVSSLKDHASSDTKILGSISRIYLDCKLSEHSKLLSCVSEHMTSISIVSILNSSIPAFSEWILTLSDLINVELDYEELNYEEPCEDEYLLYQSLQSLTKLRSIEISCGCSSRGAQELSNVIANSSTLEEVSLKYIKFPCLSSIYNLDSVLKAVLSSSTVAFLRTNFTFQINSEWQCIPIIMDNYCMFFGDLDMRPFEVQRCYASLRSIAYYSRVMPLKFSISLWEFFKVIVSEKFVTILINLLCYADVNLDEHNIIKHIRHSSAYRSSFSRALKRDVSVPLSSLRRSQSLDDLSISHHPCDYYQSCPDLSEMQSLHSLRGFDMLYCDKSQCDSKLKNHYRVHKRYRIIDSLRWMRTFEL